jgi:exodeoxyribonuclease VII small subunit
MAEKKNPAKMNFESAMQRLEEIAEALESGSRSLDESLKLFEEANRLITFCFGKLDEAEQKLKILVKEQDSFKLVEEVE